MTINKLAIWKRHDANNQNIWPELLSTLEPLKVPNVWPLYQHCYRQKSRSAPTDKPATVDNINNPKIGVPQHR